MMVSSNDLAPVLAQFNPWWRGGVVSDLSHWRRAGFRELHQWTWTPPAHRAVLLSGARQVGKTTLLLQEIMELLNRRVPPGNILYATFDHPLLKLAGIDGVLEAWRQREVRAPGPEYLFLDEAQFIRDWGTWVKHQVDFNRQRRIIFTGSATPLIAQDQESGVGRWHTIPLTTLSFYEYQQLKQLDLPSLPPLRSLAELFSWNPSDFLQIQDLAGDYVAHFHEYLLRGGFPQTALVDTITRAQRLLREDIVDKALKRDMTALFGVRRVLELEQAFLYLCMHDGGQLNLADLATYLGVKRPTAQHFLDLLEATHLIYRLPPYGYGKEVLKGRYKIYLSDPAIAPAVLLKGSDPLDDPMALGIATEAAVFKHLFARWYAQNVRFSWWRGRQQNEVDLIAEISGQMIPFEVKYRMKHTGLRELRGLSDLCGQKQIDRAYVVTRALRDFGADSDLLAGKTRLMRIPAPLLCHWMGEMELSPPSPEGLP